MFPNLKPSDRRISSIEGHLRAIEKEMGRLGMTAGRRASTRASQARSQLSDVIGPVLNEIAALVRSGGRTAADEAANFGNEAFRVGARMGNEALQRLETETEERPLIMLAVAIGVGVLIGIIGRRR
jgi:ElaB/YqjD/DUF883 family membrane-anchored ribosome-binding protein